jgi:amidase
MSARTARQAIADGKMSVRELVEGCLARIEGRQQIVKAFEYVAVDKTGIDVDPSVALRTAGALYGLPFGIKDIIDTAGIPTEYGSPIYRGHIPEFDAACVTMVKAAGGLIAGKTVSTEFAYSTPGSTTNPHNSEHTPGGSSSGSAAAVADFQVPLAFGTQTAGSVIRPSSYCGIVGYKPTFNDFNLTGVKCFSPTLDTLGVHCRAVEDLPLVRAALAHDTMAVLPRDMPPRIGVFKQAEWEQATPAMKAAIDKTASTLQSHGADVYVVDLAEIFADAIKAQNEIMFFDAARSFGPEYMMNKSLLSPSLIELVQKGQTITHEEIRHALLVKEQCLAEIQKIFQDTDVLMMPSAPGEAPAGLDSTGDAIFNRIPTFLGLPAISLPGHVGDLGLPMGIQFVGSAHQDNDLIAAALWLEHRLLE